MSWVLEHWPVLGFGINLLLGWLMWSMNKRFASKDEVAFLDKRLAKAETSLTQLPSRTEIADLQVAIAQLTGAVKETNADLRGVSKLVERVENAVIRHETIFADAARGQK